MADQESIQKLRGVRRRGESFEIDYTVGGKRFRRAVKTDDIAEAIALRKRFTEAENRRREHARTRRKSLGPFRPTTGWIAAYLRKTKQNASARGILFDLTTEHAEAMFNAQRGRCAVTGVKFSDDDSPNWRTRPYFPSLDRIDNAAGYTPENVRWVCAVTNIAINDFGESVFRVIALSYAMKEIGASIAPLSCDATETRPSQI